MTHACVSAKHADAASVNGSVHASLHDSSAARALGVGGAHVRLEGLFEQLERAVPACPGREGFGAWIAALRARIGSLRRSESRVAREAFAAEKADEST